MNKGWLVLVMAVFLFSQLNVASAAKYTFYDKDSGMMNFYEDTNGGRLARYMESLQQDSLKKYATRIEKNGKVYYRTKGQKSTFFSYTDLESFFGAYGTFVVQPNGELALYYYIEGLEKDLDKARDYKVASYRAYNLGYIHGNIQRSTTSKSIGPDYMKPYGYDSFQILVIKNGNYRRYESDFGVRYELSMYQSGRKGGNLDKLVIAALSKKRKGGRITWLTIHPRTSRSVYFISKEFSKESDLVFNGDLAKLSGYSTKPILKLGCKKVGKCKLSWSVKPGSDKFILFGEANLGMLNPRPFFKTRSAINLDLDFTAEDKKMKDKHHRITLFFSPQKNFKVGPDAKGTLAKVYLYHLPKQFKIDDVTMSAKKMQIYVTSDDPSIRFVTGIRPEVLVEKNPKIENLRFLAYRPYPRPRSYNSRRIIFYDNLPFEKVNKMIYVKGGVFSFSLKPATAKKDSLFSDYVAYSLGTAGSIYFLNDHHLVELNGEEQKIGFYNPSSLQKLVFDVEALSQAYNSGSAFTNSLLKQVGWKYNWIFDLKTRKGLYFKYTDVSRIGTKVYTKPRNKMSWSDLGLGLNYLKSWIFDGKFGKVRLLECTSAGCTLDGHRISYMRNFLQCKKSRDCSDGKKCMGGLCVKVDTECKHLSGSGQYKIVFFGADLSEQELKSYISKAKASLRSVDPYSKNFNKFSFYYRSLSHDKIFEKNPFGKSSLFVRYLGKLGCKGVDPDVKALVFGKSFRAYAVPSAKQVFVTIKEPAGMEPGYVFAHELGHIFGLADEYYEKGARSHPGPNCVKSVKEAEQIWPSYFGNAKSLIDKIKSNRKYRACGGGCSSCYKSVPNEDTLMGANLLPGTQFSPVAKSFMDKQLAAV